MDELSFKQWLAASGKNKKVQADTVSRLRTLQRELGISDLEEEYGRDSCGRILSALQHKGENEIMRSYGAVNLPIGRYTLSTYRYALNLYIRFRREQE